MGSRGLNLLLNNFFWKILLIIFFIGGSIGDCVTDSFTLSAPENRGSPIICGFNNGQHRKFKALKYYCLLVRCLFMFVSFWVSQEVYVNLWYINSPLWKVICLLLG